MQFQNQLITGTLIKRYKRFLADILLENGSIVTAHCTNSGSMATCIEAGASVMLSRAADITRKTQYTWEMIFINNGWIGVNTLIPNKLVYEWLSNKQISGFEQYDSILREVSIGKSRIDIHAKNNIEECYIEVKNVTMKDGNYAIFPDAVTSRGLKHLQELQQIKKSGIRAAMFYVIQRGDVELFAPARNVDENYANMLDEVYNNGVEIVPIQVAVSPNGIVYNKILPFNFNK